MQLRTARLCLDCEEIHEENTCPMCASEMFAFSRVGCGGGAAQPAAAACLREGTEKKLKTGEIGDDSLGCQRGAAGLAIVAASRWLLESSRAAEESPRRKTVGVLISQGGQDDMPDRRPPDAGCTVG